MNCVQNQIDDNDVLLTGPVPSAVKAGDRAKADAQRMSDERRAHRRIPGPALVWIDLARVKYGPEVKVVDLSISGVLIESDRPLAPGSRQALEIARAERSIVVPFGVLRSRVSAIDHRGAIYRSACVFSSPLDLPELAGAVVQGLAGAANGASAASSDETVASESPAPRSLMDRVLGEVATGPEAVAPAGWQKIVARGIDGTMVKGYNADFDITRPSFSLRPSPEATAEGVSLPLMNLKAIFFVRNFSGNPGYRERKTFMGTTQGRKIEVTFTDGEVVIGTTQGYRAGGAGFYLTPADPRANTARIFAIAGAVRQVRFP
jgi:hypothetical protein